MIPTPTLVTQRMGLFIFGTWMGLKSAFKALSAL